MMQLKKESDRERLYIECTARWKSEDEVTSREMRRVLRRKMTRLSVEHLNQASTHPLRLSPSLFSPPPPSPPPPPLPTLNYYCTTTFAISVINIIILSPLLLPINIIILSPLLLPLPLTIQREYRIDR